MQMINDELRLIFWDGDPLLEIKDNVVTLIFEEDEDMQHINEVFDAAIMHNPKLLYVSEAKK